MGGGSRYRDGTKKGGRGWGLVFFCFVFLVLNSAFSLFTSGIYII